MEEDKKSLIVICGHNGAGKSSLVDCLGLEDEGYKLINPDIVAAKIKIKQPGISENNAQILAGREVINERRSALESDENFCIETTLSGNSEINFIKKAKEKGFHISSYYVGLSSPKLSLQRVMRRVEAGGHDVPDADVERRYLRSLENLTKLSLLSDSITVF